MTRTIDPDVKAALEQLDNRIQDGIDFAQHIEREMLAARETLKDLRVWLAED